MKKILNREMITVMGITALGVLAMSILQPMLPLYLTSIGVSPEILGLMFSVIMIGMVFGESAWGWIADKVGLRIPMSVGTFVCGLTVFLFVFTRNVPAIFIIFFFWGIVRSALFGPGRGFIGNRAPPLKKATFMAVITVMMSASRSIGALPSGFIVGAWGFHWVFFVSCGISLLGGIAVLTGLRKTRQVEARPLPPPSVNNPPPAPEKAINYPYLSLQCIITALQFTGFGIIMTFLPLLATQVVGVTAVEVGILFTISGAAAIALGIPMGILADRKGKKTLMLLGLLVSGSSLAGMAFTVSFPWLIVLAVTGSLGLTMFNPAALGLVSDSVPRHKQSTAMGIYGGVCENTGIVAGSALGGFVWGAWGPQATFLLGAVAAGLGILIALSSPIRDSGSKANGITPATL